MKNNEYNIVNITNEKNNFSAEYTKAQKVEYSFQSENKNPIKDELNDNSTINDKVEENVSKVTKEKEKKKEKQESEALESSSSSSGAASSGASTAASSTAAASSAGATGGALGGIVAAATVSVAAIGTIVGVNVISPQPGDLVTFLSSEVTTNSIDYSFSMPSNMLLSYEEPVESRKEVVVYVKNSEGFDYSDALQYEEYDESTLVFYDSIDGLTANTSYALTIQLEETSFLEQEEVVTTTELAFRTFTTLSFAQRIVFNPLDVTYNSVSFSFEANLSDLGYNPDAPAMPNVFATIVDSDQFYDRLTLSDYEMIDDKRVTIFGDFSGLSPETTYTIDVYLDDETNLLGSATFTTLERTASVVFEEVEAGRDNVVFTFTVDKADIDYDPTGTPAVQYEVRSIDGAYYDSSWAESFVDVDDNTVRGGDSFSGLTPNTEYELEISLSTESEVISLGTTTFDTFHEFKFQKNPSADVTDTSTNFTISMRASYIGYISEEETPDVISHLSISIVEKDGGTPTTHRFATLSSYGKYVIAPSGDIGNLTPGTSYVLSVYYLPDNEDPELLGSAEFTTTGISPGFSWGTIESTPSTATISFNVSRTYLDYDTDPTAAAANLYIEVNDGTGVVDSLALNSLAPDGSEDNLVGVANASNLTPGTTYTLTLYRIVGASSVVIGQPTTLETEEPAFNGATIPTEVSFYSHEFTITLDFADDPSSPQYDNLSLQFYSGTYEDPDRYTLGSSIALQSVTTPQTLLLPSTQDGGESYYEFNFDEIGSYDIFADQAGVQTSVYHADIDFDDTDDPGVINGLESDYLIAVDASTGDFTLPVKLLYTDDYDKFGSFYVELCPTDGVTPSISAGASKEEDYQNLTYTGNDASSVITYIQNGGADGAAFDIKIYHFDDQSNPLWESDPNDPIYIKEADTNIVYGGRLYDTALSQDSTSVQFGISYVAPVSTPTNPQIKFVDSSDSSLVYSYDFNFENYPTIDMTSPAMSTGSTVTDYASLKAAFEGKTFDVVISYYDGTTQTTKTIQTGVSFTFA